VKAGGRYPMEDGHIVVDSIEPIKRKDITHDLARESGFASVEDLLKIAKHPALITTTEATVRSLCERMLAERVGAMAVVDKGKLVGIVSERDVVIRVVVERRDPGTTRVGDIMTSNVVTAHEGMTVYEALRKMDDGNFRHLPLVDGAGAVIGMLSVSHLLSRRVEELDLRNVDLQNFIAADGPGG